MEYKLMLKPIRRAKKLTQAELAVMVGVSERKLASWERGETNILFEDAYKCALALGCDVNTLCGWQSEVSEEIAGDEFEKELVNSYRSSTPEWQDPSSRPPARRRSCLKRWPNVLHMRPRDAGRSKSW